VNGETASPAGIYEILYRADTGQIGGQLQFLALTEGRHLACTDFDVDNFITGSAELGGVDTISQGVRVACGFLDFSHFLSYFFKNMQSRSLILNFSEGQGVFAEFPE